MLGVGPSNRRLRIAFTDIVKRRPPPWKITPIEFDKSENSVKDASYSYFVVGWDGSNFFDRREVCE